MGNVADAAQCCAGPRERDVKVSFPDQPRNVRGPSAEDTPSDLPSTSPVFQGKAPEAGSAAASAPTPSVEPPLVVVKEAPAPEPIAAPAPVLQQEPAPVAEAAPPPAVKEEPAPVVEAGPPLVVKEAPSPEPVETRAPVVKEHEAEAPAPTKSTEPEEELPPADPESHGQVWIVVGGDPEKGGIVVRKAAKLTSEELPRLATGAKVEELRTIGDRMKFRRLEGKGPDEGWVSLRSKGKELLVHA
uniref:Uncharacterized protein n=1 Tax=Alexandrium monilatum TaxID=311494 RepID=A0A7S4QZA5_9DINO|mmetsp:Transcript_90805/g.283941  ORF Transcript_90805/g.283941 Transcript_90805/m.283941 type:complete len:244 (-) Transcript_90805:111-842(-)